jgi:hypothetical protein
MDTNTGLVGPIIISQKGLLQPNGKLTGIDREFIVLFTVFDENKSHYLDKNILAFAPNAKDKKDDDVFIESNLMHSMNGYVYDNLPGLNMKVGEIYCQPPIQPWICSLTIPEHGCTTAMSTTISKRG